MYDWVYQLVLTRTVSVVTFVGQRRADGRERDVYVRERERERERKRERERHRQSWSVRVDQPNHTNRTETTRIKMLREDDREVYGGK